MCVFDKHIDAEHNLRTRESRCTWVEDVPATTQSSPDTNTCARTKFCIHSYHLQDEIIFYITVIGTIPIIIPYISIRNVSIHILYIPYLESAVLSPNLECRELVFWSIRLAPEIYSTGMTPERGCQIQTWRISC